MRGRDSGGHRQPAGFGGTDQIKPGPRRNLPEMQPRPGQLGQGQIAGNRQRLSLGRGRWQAIARGHFARSRRRAAGQPGILGMRNHRQPQHRAIGQQPVHGARIADPAPPGGDRFGAGLAHQRQFGQLRAFQPARGGC